MNDTSTVLKDFEECMKQYCTPVAEKLGEGLTADYISQTLERVNISDEKIKALYRWRNGIRHDTGKYVGEFDFFSHGKMLPLEEAVVHYEMYIKDGLWKENYFPLFTNHAGDYLLYDVDRNSKTYGMLLFYSPSLLIVEPETAYDSLEGFFETVIACYKQGAYKCKPENTIEVDDGVEFKISSKKNPKSDYWKE